MIGGTALRGLVVAGTDTGIGKTVCSALLTTVLDADYWKPVQAGLDEETDTEAVRRITGLADDRFHREAYRLHAPMSPDQAAAREGIIIDAEAVRPPSSERSLVIEGAGGLLVPLNDRVLQVDLFAEWKLPIVLVARSSLGTLNHTLLSVEAMRRREMSIAGIVLSGARHEENEATLRRWTDVPIVGRIPLLERIDRDELVRVYRSEWVPAEEWDLSQRAIGTVALREEGVR